jgi:hypothetical protein
MNYILYVDCSLNKSVSTFTILILIYKNKRQMRYRRRRNIKYSQIEMNSVKTHAKILCNKNYYDARCCLLIA